MSNANINGITIWSRRQRLCTNVGICMSTVAFDLDPRIELGPFHEVLVALLLKLVDKDVLWNIIAQFVIFNSANRSDVVSVLVVYIKDNINITVAAPVYLVITEFDCLASRGDVSRWHFFDDVERLVETEEHVDASVRVLGLHVDLHRFSLLFQNLIWDGVLHNIG